MNMPCGNGMENQLSFDPADPSVLAVWSGTGKVWLENPETGTMLAQFPSESGAFVYRAEGLAFSANGARLAASTMTGAIDLFNVADRSRIGTIRAASDLTSFALSADGSRVAGAADDGSVGIWDTATQFPVKPLADGGSPLAHITAFSPDLKTAASKIEQGDALLLDLSTSWGPMPATRTRDSLVSLVASADGKWIATGTVDGHVILWDAVSLKPAWTYEGRGNKDLAMSLAFSRDSSTLIFPIHGSSRQIGVYRLDIARKTLLQNFTDNPVAGEAEIYAVAAGADGRIAGLSNQAVLHLWDSSGNRAAVPGVARTGSDLVGLAFSPDGGFLAAPSVQNDSVALLDPAAPNSAPRLLTGGTTLPVQALAFAPAANGAASLLAAGGMGGFWFWDLANGQQTLGGEDTTDSLAFSPDGNLTLIGLASGNVELWDVAAGAVVGSPLVTPGPDFDQLPFGVAFSPDGKRMYAGAWQGTFRVWDWSRMPLGDLAHHLGDWPALACSIANRNLRRDEWKRYVGSVVPYRPVCSFPQR
jgi:WD40 repeat protein